MTGKAKSPSTTSSALKLFFLAAIYVIGVLWARQAFRDTSL